VWPLPIPDRTICALIEGIAREKGDNIASAIPCSVSSFDDCFAQTIIFDCCHSASGTRGLDNKCEDDEYIPRSVGLHFNIPENLDDDIWGSRAMSVANGFAYHGLQSHVLLAACRETELAYEHKGRGLFASALLVALRSCAASGLAPTYAELLKRILLENSQIQKNCSILSAKDSTRIAPSLMRGWPDFLPCSDPERWRMRRFTGMELSRFRSSWRNVDVMALPHCLIGCCHMERIRLGGPTRVGVQDFCAGQVDGNTSAQCWFR
ncbi:hypothetical protein EV363DRAFT_1495581, partial [Boletus edulis]